MCGSCGSCVWIIGLFVSLFAFISIFTIVHEQDDTKTTTRKVKKEDKSDHTRQKGHERKEKGD